jgi:hypothetical protein
VDLERTQERWSHILGPTKFGTATREELKTDADGTTVRMMIQSKAEADWLEADFAMWKDLRHSCRDGESHIVVKESPSLTFTEAGVPINAKHAAGTTFTRVVQCAPPPPYEFALPAGTTRQAAQEQVHAILHGQDLPDLARHTVVVQGFNDNQLKYHATAAMLGYLMDRRMRDCPAGFTVNRLILAAHPRPEDEGPRSLNNSYVVLGLDAPCVDAPVTAAVR